MPVPLEVYCPEVSNPEALHLYLSEQVEGLARHFPGAVNHCRIAVERPDRHSRTRKRWSVRVEASVPSHGPMCASDDSHDLYRTADQAFLSLRRQLDRFWHGRRDARREAL